MTEAIERPAVPPPPPRPARRKRRVVRAILLTGAVLLLLLGGLIYFLPALLSTSPGTKWVEGILGSRLSAPVEVGSLSLSWTGPQDIAGFRLGSPPGFPPEEDIFRAERVHLEAGLWGLLRKKDHPLRLEVEKPVMHLRRDREGRSNYEVVLRAGQDQDERRAPQEKQELFSRAVVVTVKDGDLHYHDEVRGTESHIGDFDGHLDLSPEGLALEAGGMASHSGEGANGLEPAPLKLSAHLKPIPGSPPGSTFADMTAEGKLELSGPVTFREHKVDKVSADLRLDRGELTVKNGSAGFNEGRVTMEEAMVGLVARPMPYRFRMKVEGVEANYDLARILAYVVPLLSLEDEKADFTGKLNAMVELEGQGYALPDLEKSLKGKGTLRILEGKIEASRFFGEAAKILGGNLGAVLFSELGSDFEIGDGRIMNQKIFLIAKEGSKVRSLGLKGTTGLDRTIDYAVELATIEDAIGDEKVKGILGDIKKVLGDQAVLPLKLKGTLSEPRLSLEPRIPEGAPRRALEEAIPRGLEEIIPRILKGN